MAHALALDSQQVALDLHEILRELDPVRWRADIESQVRQRLTVVGRSLSSLVDRTWPDERLDPLRSSLADLRDVLVRHTPSEGATTDAWMDLRARCHPAYEALASALRHEGTHVPSLRPTNYYRNAYHVANGVLVIALAQLVLTTRPWMVGVAGAAFVSAWSMEISRRLDPRINASLMRLFGKVAHPHEAWRINSATWYATAILVLATFFDTEVGVAAVAVLTVGDPMAAVIGRRFGRTEILNGRTLEGSLAFVVAGGLFAALVLGLFYPAPIGLLVTRALTASVAGAAAELFTRRVDDNLAIPVAAAIAGALVRMLGA